MLYYGNSFLHADFNRLEVGGHGADDCSSGRPLACDRRSSSLLEWGGGTCRRQRIESWNKCKTYNSLAILGSPHPLTNKVGGA